MLWEAIKLAIQSVRRNVLRSILTLLGIVIGVGAVIAMVTIGDGTTQKVTDDLSKLGSNMLIARPGGSMFGPGGAGQENRSFDERTIVQAAQRAQATCAPLPQRRTRAATGRLWGAELCDDGNRDRSRFLHRSGLEFCQWPAFQRRRNALRQRRLRDRQDRQRRAVRPDDPLGMRMRVGTVSCDVIGVLAAKGQGAFGNDQDNTVVMPLRAFQRRIAGNTAHLDHLCLGPQQRRYARGHSQCRADPARGAPCRVRARTTRSRCAT